MPPLSLLRDDINHEKYKAVVFDLHYTLIHLNPSRGIVYQDIFKKYNLDVRPNKIKKVFSEVWNNYGDKRISIDHSKHHNEKDVERWWFSFHRKMLKKLGCNDMRKATLINREITNQFFGNPKIHKIYNDAKKVLVILKRQKIKLALATNGYKSTERVIKHFGLMKYFDCVVISCKAGVSKPNQRFFRLVAKTLMLKPEEILCVGDSYSTDIVGAKNAGCGAAIIDRKNSDLKKKYDCIYLNNLLQIKNLVYPSKTFRK